MMRSRYVVSEMFFKSTRKVSAELSVS